MFLKETEEHIRKQFAAFTEKFERAGKEIEARIHAEPADIALLLKYLYANMPFSDVADYSYEMFREFAAHGAQLRKEQIWKAGSPLRSHPDVQSHLRLPVVNRKFWN